MIHLFPKQNYIAYKFTNNVTSRKYIEGFVQKQAFFNFFLKKNENGAESDDSLLFRRVSTVWAGGAASGLAVVDKYGAAAAGDGLSACVCFYLIIVGS
jgi:hypothetical protein